MKLERNSDEAKSLVISALPHLSLNPRKMPLPALIHYENSGVLCAAYASPAGFVGALYGTNVEFRKLESTIGKINLARALFSTEGPDVKSLCRAHVLSSFSPGVAPILTIIDSHGSGRAASELGRKRLIPPAGWRITSSTHEECLYRDAINVGVQFDGESQTGIWMNCDTHEPIRKMTEKEVGIYLKEKPISADEYAALFYTHNKENSK